MVSFVARNSSISKAWRSTIKRCAASSVCGRKPKREDEKKTKIKRRKRWINNHSFLRSNFARCDKSSAWNSLISKQKTVFFCFSSVHSLSYFKFFRFVHVGAAKKNTEEYRLCFLRASLWIRQRWSSWASCVSALKPFDRCYSKHFNQNEIERKRNQKTKWMGRLDFVCRFDLSLFSRSLTFAEAVFLLVLFDHREKKTINKRFRLQCI